MSFSNLKSQGPLFPLEAERYAREALRRSELAAANCRTVFDISYGDQPEQRLDLYLPKTPATASPVVVFAHGGGWSHGHKEWMGLMAPPLLASGVCFVSVDHRLAPEHKYPLPMQDCAAALAWVHRNIAQYGGDPHRIAVGGHSSGGHLFAMVALQPGVLEEVGVPLESIVACAPLGARLDMDFEGGTPGSVEARHHEVLFRERSEARPASPSSHVRQEGGPYLLLAWGARDIEGVAKSNQRMHERLIAAAVPHECLVLDGDHFDIALAAGAPRNKWASRIASILTAESSLAKE